jgi:hypothetical protein
MKASKSVSKAVNWKQPTLTNEERMFLQMYRLLARWDRNIIFMVLDSLTAGTKTDKTDNYSWDQISAGLGLPKARKAVRHV